MKVYLIGAGPGDPGLITVKGKDLLSKADVIIYDYLVAKNLLDYARFDAEIIYVGKKAGVHTMRQDDINRLLIDKARENKTVVRLKGGDPYIFGRGGEEALALFEAGIDFEEVPGVSSAIAAPSYAGIPLTHRDIASSVTLITGHEHEDKALSAHNWQALANCASTLVFVMGMKQLPEICHKLINEGMSQKTPAALIYWGTTSQHKSLVSNLKDLPEAAKKAAFTNPSIIVVGEVVRLKDKLNWFEKRPLFGKNIVVTRSREQASDMVAGLMALGAGVVQFPTISIRQLEDFIDIDAAISNLPVYDWIIFTSVNGVKLFWERLIYCGKDSRALAKSLVVAIGPATGRALMARGIVPDCIPNEYRAEAVVTAILAEEPDITGKRILLPRAKMARDILPESLTAAGASVDVLPVYETVPGGVKANEVEDLLATGAIDCISFASSSTVDNFFTSVSVDTVRKASPCFACIGPITEQSLKKYGFTCDIQPEEYTIPSLVAAIAKYFSGQIT